MRKSPVALAVALAALLSSPSARADPPDPAGGPSIRRDGFTFGLDLGLGLASIAGYPNDVNKIGFAGYYSATGARPTALIEGWLGGTLIDWLTVAVGVKSSTLFATGSDKAKTIGVVLHVETFPLLSLGGHLRDLGVRLDAGLGTANVADPTGYKLVDGGLTSTIGAGVFYEGIRAWKTAHGPFVMGDYFFSDTARRPAIFFGWRSVFYAHP